MQNTTIRREIITERSITEIEHSIRANLKMSTQGIIGAGNDLIDAKEKLPHGTFDEWVKIKFGLSHRSANNFMRIAREVDPESSIAKLQYTKVLALLDVPAEEREQFADESKADEATVAELKKAIAERDAAMRRAEHGDDMIASMHEKLTAMAEQVAAMQDAEPVTVEVVKAPDDYEALKKAAAEAEIEHMRALSAEERAEAAEHYAMEAERAMKQAQSEARMLKNERAEAADSDNPYSAAKLCEAVKRFMGDMGALPSMAAYFKGMSADMLKAYSIQCDALRSWVIGMTNIFAQTDAYYDIVDGEVR